jgi:hypothetical protein
MKKSFSVLVASLALFVPQLAFSGQAEFCAGFTEGYKSIKGDMGMVPMCPMAPMTPMGSTDPREGIKAGIRAAQARAAEGNARFTGGQAKATEYQAAPTDDARARAEAQKLARIESLRQQCEGARSASANTNRGSLASFYGASTAMKVCESYEQARKQR